MKRISPSLLAITGLIVLLGSFVGYHIGHIGILNNEIQELQSSLNITKFYLIWANIALEKERAIVIKGHGVRNFLSLEELEAFLAKDDTDQHEYIEKEFDCDDFALMLQRRAYEAGFIINCQKLPVGGIEHMHNLAICGNDLYYIEARTDIVTYAGFLD